MKKITIILVLCFGLCAQALSMDSSWRAMKGANKAYAFETGNQQVLGMFFSCESDSSSCNLTIALPIDCEKAAGKVVAVPIKLGKSEDVAHLTCIGDSVEMNFGGGGTLNASKASRLKDTSETEPVKINLYSWAVAFPNLDTQTVLDLDAKKKITFYLGESKHTFNLKGSHQVFQAVYEESPNNSSMN